MPSSLRAVRQRQGSRASCSRSAPFSQSHGIAFACKHAASAAAASRVGHLQRVTWCPFSPSPTVGLLGGGLRGQAPGGLGEKEPDKAQQGPPDPLALGPERVALAASRSAFLPLLEGHLPARRRPNPEDRAEGVCKAKAQHGEGRRSKGCRGFH